ncbi:MAG: efflux family protein [Gemmatimonadetes bacterium]|nr:efflux family protein [Gemmatimonadota bacterium]
MSSSVKVVNPPAHQPASVWSAIREALSGAHGRDFTEGPIGRAIFILAVPMVLEMCMESIFAVVDVFVVAHLGADAVATVGISESFMTLIYAMSMGLSIGAGAMISRRIGEKDADGASHTAAQVLLFGLVVAVVLGIFGAFFAPQLLAAMGASAGVQKNIMFTRIMLGCNASVVMLYLVNAVFRSAGDAAIAMRVLWLANTINIILAPTLVFGWGPFPKMGIIGAAVATTIGRSAGAVFALSRLVREGSRIRVRRVHFALDPALIGRVVKLSSSATFQVFIGMASWIGLIRILAGFGSDALAGYTIGMRIVIFALLPSFGLANAAATMVGQALGAKKPDRAEQAVWAAGRYSVVFLGVVGLVFFIFATQIVGLFTQEAGVASFGIAALRTIACGFPFYAYGMTVSQSFNGAGDTKTPTYINLGVFWAFEIPAAWILSHALGLGPQGVFLSAALAFSMVAIVSTLLFRRGHWKTRVV